LHFAYSEPDSRSEKYHQHNEPFAAENWPEEGHKTSKHGNF
jgi:hypothetical protein